MTIILLHFWNNSIEISADAYYDRHYYNVSTATMDRYKEFFRWAFETGIGKHQVYQGGWAIKIEEVSDMDKKQYSLLIHGDIAFVHEFDHIPVPTEFPGFLWSMAGDTEVVVVDAATQEQYVNPLARGVAGA